MALTLRTLCGLPTEEIARAFLVPATTMAQRLVRAKGKIRDARHPLPGAAAGRAAGAARGGDGGRLPRVQRGLRGDARATRWCGASCAPRRSGWRAARARCCRRRAAEVDGAAGADAPPRRAARRARRRARAIWCCSTSRIARAGIAREIDEGLALVAGGARARARPGRTRCRRRSRRCTPRRRRADDTDWPQIVALYAPAVRRCTRRR